MSKKSLIDSIEVKTPCSEDWDEMRGNEKARFCSHCSKHVNNLSTMTRKEAMRLVRASGGKICVRYVKNPVNNRPVFAGKLYQITRRARITAGVLGASLTLSTLAYAQPTPVIIKSGGGRAQTQASQETKIEKTINTTSSVSGTVTDQNGAVVSGATVTVKSTGTTSPYNSAATTDENGFYRFENLPVGTYHVTVATLNFKNALTEITVELDKESFFSPKLEVSSSETVIVGGAAFVEYENPLHRAVAIDNLEEVKILIAKGERVNGRDKDYDDITPLFLAVENGSVEITEMLLNLGARVNARSATRQTALMRIDEDATPELIRALIKHGAKLNLTDDAGNTVLILASHMIKTEVLQTLISYGADVDAQNDLGHTALMNAVLADNIESVRALILAGANLNLKNKEGDTAWDLTVSDEIEKLLESYGAIVKDN